MMKRRFFLPLAPLTLASLVACTTSSEPAGGPAPEVGAPPAPAAAALDAAALAKELCGEAAGCRLEKAHPAGEGPSGEALTVLELAIPNPPEAPDSGYAQTCHPHRQQFWRVTQRGASVEKLLLLDLCNDGYGAAGLGEDYVTVSANRLIHSQSGGSNSRWGFSRTYSLAPLVLQKDESCFYHTAFGTAQSVNTDWLAPRSISRWDAQDCGAQTDAVMDCDTPSLRYQYDLIPLLPEGTSAVDWGATALGSCAFEMDAAAHTGYVTHGAPGEPRDASLKALLADKRTLVVEVIDDQWVSGASSWLYDDHLELWVGADAQAGECIEAGLETVQWGIRVADGEVFVGKGKRPWKPAVRRIPFDAGGGRQGHRLIITLGEDADVLTVVYSDSDDGKTQERLMATSRLKHGVAASLGRALTLLPTAGRCEVGSALTWRPAPIPTEGLEGAALSVD